MGTCEVLRPWSMRHKASLKAEILSLACNEGALRAEFSITNSDAVHPAFWVRLALETMQKGETQNEAEGEAAR